MKLVDELFRRYTLIENSLIQYGFTKSENVYSYNKLIHNNDFELQVSVTDGKIFAKLIDKEFDDEFSQINVETIAGGFIASLREECSEILIDIRNHCFEKEYFIYSQTNRITDLIKNKYNVEPEFLWDKYPGFGVFRNKGNEKWFGIIMNVPRCKIAHDSDDEIEVLNIKLDEKVDEYLKHKGIYPSYHMSKKNWVSIILDDTISDNELMGLIDLSVSKTNNK